MEAYGQIKNIRLTEKIITLQMGKYKKEFYVQAHLIKKFKIFLVKNNLVFFKYDEKKKVLKEEKEMFSINTIYRITNQSQNKVYFDVKTIQQGIKKLFDNTPYKIIMDLEMMMPSYRIDIYGFTSEIIQVGYYLIDENNEIIKKYRKYIKPTKINHITSRTVRFLGLNREEVMKNWITYKEFYDDFKGVLNDYHPKILVWGKNDIIVFNDEYKINNLHSLTDKSNFINLLSVYKNYHSLNNDIGLVRLYKELTNIEVDEQAHDALEDAYYTYQIYLKFIEEMQNLDCDVKEEI